MDADLFSNVTYRIKSAEARKLFSVNPISGELLVLQTLDFEDLASMGMGTNYTFQVEAVDQAGTMPPGEATVTVRITVRPAEALYSLCIHSPLPLCDPLQFASRVNRSVDYVVNRGLHYILKHLDNPKTYAKILFVDFISAFNTHNCYNTNSPS